VTPRSCGAPATLKLYAAGYGHGHERVLPLAMPRNFLIWPRRLVKSRVPSPSVEDDRGRASLW
jgi:hypothetical protein